MADDPVREFYTQHPYPPPVENLDRARAEWRDETRHRAEHHLFWPDQPYRPDIDILVAGCGTWQAAKYAACRPAAQVVGIDVSPASLEHTDHLKRQYGLTNLSTCLLPIERAAELDRRFDLVVCTGVLHHLADPDAGLGVLRSVLKPNGRIYLMVYAPYGRAGIYMLQEYCRRLGLGASREDVDELMGALKALPQQHPLAALLRGSRDAANADAIADALLNPRDRSYSVPQLFDLLGRHDLVLARWYWQAPYLSRCGAIASTTHATRLAALPDADAYAAMELWRGTMTAHSAVLRQNDASEAAGLRFDDERWRGYVPIRLPWTQLVEERLPPGAAGVLLNRSHQHPDLILAIDAEQKRLFDGINGRHSIARIAEDTTVTNPGSVRTFFERLWSYDQVVFDSSQAR